MSAMTCGRCGDVMTLDVGVAPNPIKRGIDLFAVSLWVLRCPRCELTAPLEILFEDRAVQRLAERRRRGVLPTLRKSNLTPQRLAERRRRARRHRSSRAGHHR